MKEGDEVLTATKKKQKYQYPNTRNFFHKILEIDAAIKTDSLTMSSAKRYTQSTFSGVLYYVKDDIQFTALEEMAKGTLTAGAISKQKVF